MTETARRIVIVKIGSSSLTDPAGRIRAEAIEKLCAEVAAVRRKGWHVVVVTSGAIAAGLPALGFESERPRDARTLQAASAVGQNRLMSTYEAALATHGIVAGQILLSPMDFFERSQYLHARGTLSRLLELDVVPLINENDAVADDAIRFGDNDRIAALVAHLISADRLVLLTDTSGLFSADPHSDPGARFIAEIASLDDMPEINLGGAGSVRGSGGMASKIAAARMASWSGVPTVIASASLPDVLVASLEDATTVGTIVRPHQQRPSAKKLWIAFAVEPNGRLVVDDGARRALMKGGGSLLPVGVTSFTGGFTRGDAVEVVDADGTPFARGLAAVSAVELASMVGVRNDALPAGTPDEVIHRDELVIVG